MNNGALQGSVLACDFPTVNTVFLRRSYVLFFISLATRRIDYITCTSNPDGRWTAGMLVSMARPAAEGFRPMDGTETGLAIDTTSV